MNEKYQANADSRDDVFDHDDPLAELARIVAGEDEFEAAPVKPSDTQDSSVSNVAESMEQDLATELNAALEEDHDYVEQVLVSDNAALDDLEAALKTAETEIASVVEDNSTTNEIESIEIDTGDLSSELDTALDEALSSADFVNDINAIADNSVTNANAEVEIPAESAPAEETKSFQDELLSDLEMQLSPEPNIQQEEIYTETSDLMPEDVVSEAIVTDLEDEVNSEVVVNSQLPEDDLGDAFVNEFASMMDENNASTSVPVTDIPISEDIEEDISIPSSEDEFYQAQLNTVRNVEVDTSQPIEISSAVSQEDALPEIEMDFEAAFAEELSTNQFSTEVNSVADTSNATPEYAPEQQTANTDTLQDDVDPAFAAQQLPENSNKKYAVMLMIFALFAGVIAAGYGFLGGSETNDGNAPIIKASTDPVKIKPEDPGGRVVANQDNASYEKVEGNALTDVTQESLISTTEEPAVIDQDALPSNVTATNLTPKNDDRLDTSDASNTGGNSLSSTVQPRVVQVVTVKPDGTIVRSAPPKPAASPSLDNQVAGISPSVARSAIQSVQTEEVTAETSIDGAQSTNQPAIPTASPLAKPEPAPVVEAPRATIAVATPTAEPTPTPVQQTSSEWVVQVSSQRSEQAARQSFSTMQNRFAALQGRSVNIQQANVNGSTYFRARVQTASRSDANQLCTQIKNSGGSCFVTR